MAFPGYFYVHGVAGGTAYEALVYQHPFGSPLNWVVPSVETVVGLGTALGKPIDPNRGVLLLFARDCSGAVAEGVSFTASTADSDTTPYYVLAGAPSLARSETLASANGQGGFANLPAGYATVTANINGLCALYGRMDLLMRAGAITIANFPPTPLN